MQCFIYKCSKKDELYIYLQKQDDFTAIPEALRQSLGQLSFVMELELNPERKLAREDVNKVIANIQNKGFFVQMPPLIANLLTMTTGSQQLH
jgi:uncharacterized protein YcgL (UPF0745 family)